MSERARRIGIIGLSAKGSWASRSHLPYLQATDLYTISALKNSSKSSAQAAAEAYSLGQIPIYDEPAEIAKDSTVDIVAVSVNVPEHYKLIRPALEAGKDVFCEWPLARNYLEAKEICALADKMRVRTMVGLQARQNPSILKAKEIVSSGKLGRILGTTMYGHGMIFGSTINKGLLYALPLEAGANLLTIPFGHAVDALCFVLGELRDISATLANNRPELDLVDEDGKAQEKVRKTAHDHVSITANLVLRGGVVNVTYAGGLSRTCRDFYWEINGTKGSLVLVGEKMGGHVQMSQPKVKIAMDGDVALQEINVEETRSFSFSKFATLLGSSVLNNVDVGKAWDAWAGKGLEQGYSVTTFSDALIRHAMIDAIYRSAERGSRQNYV